MIPNAFGMLDENIPIKIKYDFGEGVEGKNCKRYELAGKKKRVSF